MGESYFLVNLVYVLSAALIGSFIAARLRLPVMLGYILAGIVVGPYTPGFVGDSDIVQAMADIGIVLLMFAVGVQLSFRDLFRSGRVAIAGSAVQICAVMGLGYLVGIAMGMGSLESLFLGAVVTISSSAVLSKILNDVGGMDTDYGQLTLAWAAVQDLAVIVLVLVLGALAGDSGSLATDLLWSTGKALIFLALLAPIGTRILPIVFERVAELNNRELFVMTIAAVALGTAYLSSLFGISLALGAFIAGVVVSESDLSHHILGEITPLRDVFAALFFVSVGMLFNPEIVVTQFLPLLAVLGLIVVVKGAVATALVVALGRSPRVAIRVGALLAQAAEFSFLLASIGRDLNVVSTEVFGLMIAGSAASILLAPGLYALAGPFTERLERMFPPPRLEGDEIVSAALGAELRGHVVICGLGRVGSVIASALDRRGFRYVVIDHDRTIVRALRERGAIAILGNAANVAILDRVAIDRARLVVVAIPDAVAARQIIDNVVRLNPRVDIVARTHSLTERQFMESRGVRQVVVGELELALQMTRHALRRFGVSQLETEAVVQGLRDSDGMDDVD